PWDRLDHDRGCDCRVVSVPESARPFGAIALPDDTDDSPARYSLSGWVHALEVRLSDRSWSERHPERLQDRGHPVDSALYRIRVSDRQEIIATAGRRAGRDVRHRARTHYGVVRQASSEKGRCIG